jgi:thymidine phosphorylase
LGGPKDIIDKPDHHLKPASFTLEVRAETPGVITAVDTRTVGLAVIELGGGRRLATDKIDHSVGLTAVAAPGERSDAPLAIIHARDETSAQRAAAMLRAAFTIGDTAPTPGPVVREHIG